MTFLIQEPDLIETYIDYLRSVCSISRLFSSSNIPYLHYRIAENVFCRAFNTPNLARSDGSYDSAFGDIGIGLKTFISEKGVKFEKIAEFNKLAPTLKDLDGLNLAIKVSDYRNERIYVANRTYGLKKAVYHCIARKRDFLEIFETKYEPVRSPQIKITMDTPSTLIFVDGINEYSFARSKSTLFRRFKTPVDAVKVPIEIIDDPYEKLLELFESTRASLKPLTKDYVILPLYSEKGEADSKLRFVPTKDGLNKWNANGRRRDSGEVKIRIPARVHHDNPRFFPNQGVPFELQVPTGEIFAAAAVEAGRKGLLTNPNKALSKWLLRDLLNLKEGELATYQRLEILGFDSVKVTKIRDGFYTIDVAESDESLIDSETG